jgi:hypothetical protein
MKQVTSILLINFLLIGCKKESSNTQAAQPTETTFKYWYDKFSKLTLRSFKLASDTANNYIDSFALTTVASVSPSGYSETYAFVGDTSTHNDNNYNITPLIYLDSNYSVQYNNGGILSIKTPQFKWVEYIIAYNHKVSWWFEYYQQSDLTIQFVYGKPNQFLDTKTAINLLNYILSKELPVHFKLVQ